VYPSTANAIRLNFHWGSYAKAMGFRIERRARDSTGLFDTISMFPWGGATGDGGYIQDSSFIDSGGLSPNKVYYYRASAYNILGETFSDTVPLKTAPAAPQNLVAVQVSRTSARLSWNSPPSGADGFKIRRTIPGTSLFGQIADVGPTDTVYTDTGLTPDSTYKYVVCAYNFLIDSVVNGESMPSDTATVILVAVKSVAAGDGHSMILKSDGTLWAWGLNLWGELGDGSTTNRLSPFQTMSGVSAVSAGNGYTMILKTDSTLWACGYNASGQLGDGTTTNRLSPVFIMSDVKAVSAGTMHTMIIKTDGTLWATGSNYFGQFGTGDTISRTTPIQIPMNDVSAVSAGGSHTMVLKTDGTLWATGDNEHGQLGDGTTTGRSTLFLVMSGVSAVSAGVQHTMIIQTNGALLSMGYNQFGQLGDGTITDRLFPIQIMTGVAVASASARHTMIVKTDGTLWAMGFNENGELGDSTKTEQHLPEVIKVNGISGGLLTLATGWFHSLIVKTDGTCWATGDNRFGQLGDGTTTVHATS
jgi:alpha-tubulin suppressor-like RCC1 family protein